MPFDREYRGKTRRSIGPKKKVGRAKRRGAANRLRACTTRTGDSCGASTQRRGKRARTYASTRTYTVAVARVLFSTRSTRLPHTEEEKASVEVIGWVYTGRCWILFAEDSDKRPSTSFPLATSASCDSTDTARDITLSNDTFSPLPTSSFSFAPSPLSPFLGSKAS